MKTGNIIYFDHQATTPVEQSVLAAMMPYQSEYFGNPHSSDHQLGWISAKAVEDSVAQLASLIEADNDEIVFTSGATESNNAALLGLGRRAARGKRRRVLLGATEHKSVLAVGSVLQSQYGYSVEPVPVDRDGLVAPETLNDLMDNEVLVVSIMAVNNEIGTIQDIERISEIVRRFGAVYHCDATQAPMAIPMTNFGSCADLISLSSHKMYGPKGIGVMYVSRNVMNDIEPIIYGGEQQNGLRSGTTPAALCVGMSAAAALMTSDGISRNREELSRRRDQFVQRLQELSWPITLNGPEGQRRHPGNANVCIGEVSAHELLGSLQPRLAASTGSACTTGIPEPSHVLRALGLSRREAECSVRFSLGFQTSDRDVEEAVALISSAIAGLQGT